jgi:hypothetical protein
MTNYKEMPLIGTGFQHVIDSYFWNLPFASVRQCKFVMDKANIPEYEWTAKRCVALTAGPCGWMRLSINGTKLDPKKPVQTTVLSRLRNS